MTLQSKHQGEMESVKVLQQTVLVLTKILLQSNHDAERESWNVALLQVEHQLQEAHELLKQKKQEVELVKQQHMRTQEEMSVLHIKMGQERDQFTAMNEAQV